MGTTIVPRPSRRLVSLVVAAVLVSAVPATVSANHTWRGYHWARTANPFVIQVGSNVGNGWKSYLQSAATEWTKSSVLDVQLVGGSTSSCSLSKSVGTIQVCNGNYGNTGWLGIAGVSVSNKHIVAAYVKLNDSYFNTSTYSGTAWRNLVMCQEVGHGFGLAHQDERFTNANLNTCMDYTNLPESNQAPNQHDYDMLQQIYNHTDSTSTLAGSPAFVPNAVQGLLAGRTAGAAWGALVEVSEDGRSATYLRELGGGLQEVTHVFWVEGADSPHHHDH